MFKYDGKEKDETKGNIDTCVRASGWCYEASVCLLASLFYESYEGIDRWKMLCGGEVRGQGCL